ncbi:MAG TPA: dihydropteroate synthase [Thermoplasmata archaeon]|nr:dihydropteroate synthase [Thermoplasmata archaeon]
MPKSPRVWRHRSGEIVLDRTHVMGVLNVTPDSFSDGGRYLAPEAAIQRGLEIAEQGASILDVGGESTRPGSASVSAEEEWRRIDPVLRGLARKIDIPISIDTRKPEVAEEALGRGATIINDVTGLSDPDMARLAAKERAGVVVMHMRGDPATMQQAPRYTNVVEEVRDFLADRAKAAMAAGIEREAIAVDPGIGFGKTVDHNLELLRNLDGIATLGHPVVVGVSRKSFIAHLDGGERMEDRLAGSVAAATLAAARGADLIRAHDVAETVRAMRVADGVLRGRANL